MTWLLCDYGGVLSRFQPDHQREELVAASGRDSDSFWRAYWEYRPSYDRADLTAEEYWSSIASPLTSPTHLERLVALDVASWLHEDMGTVAAALRARERGYQLAILSNAPIELARALHEASWLADFDPRLFSCELREIKPDPAIYAKTVAHLAADPADVIFFDDRPENVTAAVAAGLRAHRFADASQLDRLPNVEGMEDRIHRVSRPPH